MNIEEKVLDLIVAATGLSKEELLKHRTEKNQWSSLQHVEIVFALEDTFGLSFTQEELAQLTTVQNIIDCVSKKLS